MTHPTHAVPTLARDFIDLEERYGAHNYHPLPVVLTHGAGVYLVDESGRRYLDMMSAYSAVSFGHGHPVLVKALTEQAQRLAITSRAFHSNNLGVYCKYITEYFGYQRVLPMNTGAEAVETALKLCRKWAYEVKKLPKDTAEIVVCRNNFHGRTTTIVSFSIDPDAYNNYGPFTPGFVVIPYNDAEALAKVLDEHPHVAGFLVEPIQGEAGAYVPDEGYLKKCYDLCRAHNVLFIADEVQTGMGRTGRFLFTETWPRRPDAVLLGKMLGGGLVTTAAMLTKQELFDRAYGQNFETAEGHNATFSGNAVSCVAALAALELVTPQLMAENLRKGSYLREQLTAAIGGSPLVAEVRSWGMILGIELRAAEHPWLSFDHFGMGDLARHPTVGLLLCRRLYRRGFYGFVCGHNWSVLRLQPRFTITQERMDQFICALKEEIEYLCALN